MRARFGVSAALALAVSCGGAKPPSVQGQPPVTVIADLRCSSRGMTAHLVYDSSTEATSSSVGRLAVKVRSMPSGIALEGVLLIASPLYLPRSTIGDTLMTDRFGIAMLELTEGVFSVRASLVGYFGGSVPVAIRAGTIDSLHLELDQQVICN